MIGANICKANFFKSNVNNLYLNDSSIYALKSHTNSVYSVNFSPNGKYIVSGSSKLKKD